MKKQLKRMTALLLALTLVLGLTTAAHASEALGSELADRTTRLASGLSLTEGSLWSATYSDLRTEHYLTYTPGTAASPMVFSGKYVASINTVSSAAAQMEAQGWRVAAAVNGGFFNTDGTLVGMLVTDGVLRAADRENYAMVGITAAGEFFVDESKLVKTAQWQTADGGDYGAVLTGFNAYRTDAAGLYLYNGDFASKVNSSEPCVYAILRPYTAAGLTINGSLAMGVVSVTDTAGEGAGFNGVIPEGCYMLYAGSGAGEELLSRLRSLSVGQTVTVSVTGGSSRWAQAKYGLSALVVLARDGQVVSGLEAGAAPRTAIGIKADGTVILYTIDGRQSGYSVGASYTQVAQRLIELGCVTAVALDGGGSTTLGATLPGSGSFEVVNQPSGSLRAVNNSILFLAPARSTGVLEGYYLEGSSRVVLAGSTLDVTATAYDTAGYPTAGAAPRWSASGGTVLGNGGSAVYLAGRTAGSYQITASSGTAQGSLPVRVVTELSALTVSRSGETGSVTQLLLAPNDTVQLDVAGLWYNLPVAMDIGCVEWTVKGGVGTVDDTGLFTAVNDNAAGTLTATAGGRSVSIQVKVDRGDPFTDMGGHWGAEYVTRLYKLGITSGVQQPDGSYKFLPNQEMSRGELLVFLARLLKLDLDAYAGVELPFADAGSIPDWMLPSVKALYALQVFEGSANNGVLTANVGAKVTREESMTMMGRVLAGSDSCDLSAFADGNTVSAWAAPYVQTLVARGVVEGSGGLLFPRNNIDRASAAKLLVLLNDMDKAGLTLRPGLELSPAQSGGEAPEA